MFNPHKFNNGNVKKTIIKKYYEDISERLREDIEEDTILDNIECEDDLKEFASLIDKSEVSNSNKKINEDLEGKQKDCHWGEINRRE